MFNVNLEIFCSYGNITTIDKRLQIFGLCCLWAGTNIYRAHLLWHGASVFAVRSERIPQNSYPFHDNQGFLRTYYSNPDHKITYRTIIWKEQSFYKRYNMVNNKRKYTPDMVSNGKRESEQIYLRLLEDSSRIYLFLRCPQIQKFGYQTLSMTLF